MAPEREVGLDSLLPTREATPGGYFCATSPFADARQLAGPDEQWNEISPPGLDTGKTDLRWGMDGAGDAERAGALRGDAAK